MNYCQSKILCEGRNNHLLDVLTGNKLSLISVVGKDIATRRMMLLRPSRDNGYTGEILPTKRKICLLEIASQPVRVAGMQGKVGGYEESGDNALAA